MSESKRIYGLDILRAFAIIEVLYYHAGHYLTDHILVRNLYYSFSVDGVSVFFVLSGFLIGQIILKTINTENLSMRNLFDFWVRRWFRTLPNYFLILMVLFLLATIRKIEIAPAWYTYFVFAQNLISIHSGFNNFFVESWSLCVEEWFYLIVPLLLFITVLLFKVNKRAAFLLCATLIITLSTVYKIYRTHLLYSSDEVYLNTNIRMVVITRLDSIMYGCLGAYFSYYKFSFWSKKNILFYTGITLLCFTLIVPSLFKYGYGLTAYFTILPVSIFLLLPKLSSINSGKGLIHRAITFISIVSYSLYLVNLSIVREFLMPKIIDALGLTNNNGYVAISLKYTLFIAISISLAYMIYTLYEKPMTKLREKFAKGNAVKAY
jgi:peptidoglycan/LPS O-acetylase OafA/YrhL